VKFLQETIETTQMLTAHAGVVSFCIVGSAIYHPEPADVDFLVHVCGETFISDARWAFGSDWTVLGGRYDNQNDKWGSIRKANVNLIVTTDGAWYERAKLANEVCVALKLMDKGDRIVAYRVIRDGYNAEQANARRDGRR
jgi:hypothetical protein